MAARASVVCAQAPARVALAGNPSDGYGGKTLSLAIANFSARVTVRDAARLEVTSGPLGQLSFASLGELVREVRASGYGDPPRLLRAALVRFADLARERGLEVDDATLAIEYRTSVPPAVGLGGSSAVVSAALLALCERFGVAVEREELPALILSVETEELGIAAGLQDRVAQVYGGLTYMDFDPELAASRGEPRYEALEPGALPPLFVAWVPDASEPSDVVHAGLRRRFDAGEPAVLGAMLELAALAADARRAVIAGDAAGLGAAMESSLEARRSIVRLDPRHLRLVELAREHGCAANYAGSGGAIVGLCADASRLPAIIDAFAAEGLAAERCRPAAGASAELRVSVP